MVTRLGGLTMRTFWIIWCVMWAVFYMLAGFFFFPIWLGVPFSLFAILIPIGSADRIAIVSRGEPPPIRPGRPLQPSSRLDTRFTEAELRQYWGW